MSATLHLLAITVVNYCGVPGCGLCLSALLFLLVLSWCQVLNSIFWSAGQEHPSGFAARPVHISGV